uniref:Macrophage-expressed gene 1 protein n=1 Tax=Panagrolaimus sp. ES5 TaxID=591445 RepID=A0AC34FV98_9BILA
MGNMLTTTTSGIVGVGWDDLTNKITLPILATKYDLCKTTPDGHFLIPDNVLAIPVQEVIVDQSAKSYKSYKDVEKENIRANREEMGSFVGGGSFSKGNQETKKHFSNGNTMMMEAQIGYKAFIFIAEAKELDSTFQGKIDEIIESLNDGRQMLAQYQAECLIRDYGTHVVNKALTGATMKYKAFVNTEGLHAHDARISKMESEAAASFLFLAKGGTQSTSENQEQIKTGFEEHKQYSTIETKGGADVRNILNAKEQGGVLRMDNIVGLEHEGIPIYTIIHKNHFSADKNYNASVLLNVQNLLFEATIKYYSENTISGCTDPTAENFDYQANFDDNTCKTTKRELLFDGVFQRRNSTSSNCVDSYCDLLKNAFGSDVGYKVLCKYYTVDHPITREPACPEGYEEVLLKSFDLQSKSAQVDDSPETFKRIFGLIIDHTLKQHGSFHAQVEHSTYWCRRTNNAATAHGGALFGGFVNEKGENIITKALGCPKDYELNKLFGDFDICVSYDYNAGKQHSIPFGGFYSCISEVKECPPGFKADLLKIVDQCAVFYCVHPNAHNSVEAVLKRPPFTSYHEAAKNAENETPSK